MNIKAEYMLNAPLETLHFETKEWIGELLFYVDELKILEILAGRKMAQCNVEEQIYIHTTVSLKQILDRLSNGGVKELMDHEKYLSELLSVNGGATEADYRKKHRLISKHMIRSKEGVIMVKGSVFSFLEQPDSCL